jgi:hypothetical protein
MSDNLPSPLPPRDFSNAFSRFLYYIANPQIITIIFIYFWGGDLYDMDR